MSIFTRPESPPPRAPSPDYTTSLNPLPIRKKSQVSLRPSTASCCSDASKPKPVLRSQLLGHDLARRPSKGILKPSPPPSPSMYSTGSSKSLSNSNSGRSLQSALPYRSPPASPTLASAPPPVPPIPEFRVTADAEEAPKKKSRDEKTRKRRQSRAGALTGRFLSFCTSGRSVAVCTA
ncbi:hypothetical protein BDP27DRAFT_1312587 [Rhodocollybia butyracea]|uniref:Uncharacterized protein n=1 Tax=Rhodocollybia butyracea TaxID=206335 RepID=A0A9P5UF11_9AGAR|nr:hypothetical protein BDP27DRAFT_1312587 [Rhodocollybia butyracea]